MYSGSKNLIFLFFDVFDNYILIMLNSGENYKLLFGFVNIKNIVEERRFISLEKDNKLFLVC